MREHTPQKETPISPHASVRHERITGTINAGDLVSVDNLTRHLDVDTFGEKELAYGFLRNDAQAHLSRLEADLNRKTKSLEAQRVRYYKGVKKDRSLTEATIKTFVAEEVANDRELNDLQEEILTARTYYENLNVLFWGIKAKTEYMRRTA